MRLFVADLLMTLGALVVLLGWLLSSGIYAPRVIGFGIGLALLGYAFDWRSEPRALIVVGIAISRGSVYLVAALVLGIATAGVVRVGRGLGGPE